MATTTFDRDQMAKWYAGRHFETDAGVEQIFYLPTRAPAGEIRFIEVNNMIAESSNPEPIDFGIDRGSNEGHTLVVLDVTPKQWAEIEAGKMSLPSGWTLKGKQPLGPRRPLKR